MEIDHKFRVDRLIDEELDHSESDSQSSDSEDQMSEDASTEESGERYLVWDELEQGHEDHQDDLDV